MEQQNNNNDNTNKDSNEDSNYAGVYRRLTEEEYKAMIARPKPPEKGAVHMGALMVKHNERIKKHAASVLRVVRETKSK